jgi:hypothetical protein
MSHYNSLYRSLWKDLGYHAGLTKKREILIFPRTAGNTGISREILVSDHLENLSWVNYEDFTNRLTQVYIILQINVQFAYL